MNCVTYTSQTPSHIITKLPFLDELIRDVNSMAEVRADVTYRLDTYKEVFIIKRAQNGGISNLHTFESIDEVQKFLYGVIEGMRVNL